MATFINDFRLNQVGFPQYGKKCFVYHGAPRDTFEVKQMHNAVYTTVYVGEFVPYEEDTVSPACLMGDFTAVTEPGVYRIYCGDTPSRTFYIGGDIYDSVCRVLTIFFEWQRCCDNGGWAGLCHHGGHIVDKKGMDHLLLGGHHQSGEVRKWAFGVPDGIFGLSEYLLLGNPRWNKGTIEYDIAHSAKYFLSRISDEGYIYDCTFLPESYRPEISHGKGFETYSSWWEPSFKYFDRPTDPRGHWIVARMLASASRSLKTYDPILASQCLSGAKKVWNYMMDHGEHVEDFDWEIYPPMGHGNFREVSFSYYYKNSTWMLCSRAAAAVELYAAEPDELYKERAVDALGIIASRMIKDEDGALHCFSMGGDDKRIAETVKYQSMNLQLPFVRAMELWPDAPQASVWLDCIEAFVKKFEKQAASNAYGRASSASFPAESADEVVWNYWAPSFNHDLADMALFLTKASAFVGRERCLSLAQRQLDFTIGANPADASCIEAVGYNHPQHALFGEYFPSQPQIPGGIFTDIKQTEPDFDWFGTEYDMPIVGAYLYALALYQKTVDWHKGGND